MIDSPVNKSFPRMLVMGVIVLSASPLLIMEMFPGQLKFVMEPSSYLVFHNIAEFFSILVSLSMFGMSWYTYEQSKNQHSLFLGTAFLAIGIMDFMHTMSMPTMPAFITPNDPQKSVQFWMPVRLFQGFAFLASAYVYRDKPISWLSKKILLTASLFVTAIVFIGIIFFQPQMPTLFVSGTGVTPLKKYCEYLVIFLLGAATLAYWRRIEKTGDRVLFYYLAAFIVSIFSELPLAFYARAFDTYNVLGHVNKFIAFFLIYYGVYRASVKDPYVRLKAVGEKLQEENVERKRAEEALREAHGHLETRVKERTAELLQSNERLQKEIAERQKGEEALREAHDRALWLGRFPEENPNPIMRVTAEGRVLYCNPAAKRLAGWNCEAGELIPHTLLKVFGKAMGSGTEVQEDIELGRRVYTVSVAPIIEECYANIYGRDITEREQAEEALRESEQRFSTLYSSMTEGVAQHQMIYDTAGQTIDYMLVDVNPAYERITGLSRDRVVGKKASEIYGLNQAPFLDLYSRVASSGQATMFETYFQPMQKYFEISVFSPAKGRFATVFQDVTQRKLTEETLKENEERFRVIASNTPDHILVQDRNLRYTLVINPQLGLTEKDLIGKTDYDILSKEDADKLAKIKRQVLETAKPAHLETPLLSKEGAQQFFEGSYVPKFDVKGQTDGLIGYFRNVTEERRMREELQRSRDELEVRIRERTDDLWKSRQRLQQLSSQLLRAQESERKRVAVELHDGLLSELAATKFLLEGKLALLEKGKLSDIKELKRVGDTLGIAMKEARRIMNNLHPAVLDELGLIAATNWLCAEYQKSYPQIKIEILTGVTEGEISESIRVVIFRVLQEALNNFARHGRGDWVELSLSKPDGTFALTIRDNGQGFDVETAQKGLGLESMRERVELSGGEFQIESILGQGTTIQAIWRLS